MGGWAAVSVRCAVALAVAAGCVFAEQIPGGGFEGGAGALAWASPMWITAER